MRGYITTPQVAYWLAILGGLVFLASLLGWVSWVTRVRKKRIWRAGSVDPESKEERWHEDAAAVFYLAVILGMGLVTVVLVILMWPSRASY